MAESILARIARQGGGKLLDTAVGKLTAATPVAKPTLVGKIASFALLRVATRSVPGAIIVTGGILAKRLHDQRKARLAAAKDKSQ